MPKRLGTIGYDPEIKRSYIVRHNRLGSATVILKYSLHFRTEWQLNGPQVTSVGYRTRMEFGTMSANKKTGRCVRFRYLTYTSNFIFSNWYLHKKHGDAKGCRQNTFDISIYRNFDISMY